jgi:hypothetical protein
MPALTSEQEIAIIHAAKPLQADERTAFMAGLTTWLNGRAEVGDGELGRELRELQKMYFQPPTLVGTHNGVDAYPRRGRRLL